jgi:glycerol-3-phosphate dehydrogenase subunit C
LARLNFSPEEGVFWDGADLEREYRRELEVCAGCRICFNLCPAFPDFFGRIDKVDGDISKLGSSNLDSFTDLCFECKLCDLKCPYTPPHEFEIDIPRTVLRARAIRARNGGIPLGDRLLGDTDGVGAMGSRTAPLSNWGNRNRLARFFMEKAVGVDRRRKAPSYGRPTFKSWFERQPQLKFDSPTAKVALFYTCLVNYNDPSVGRALVALLSHHRVETVVPEQKCCGMPAMDGGNLNAAMAKARFNVSAMYPYVAKGLDVIVPSPTCGYVLKKEYPRLLGTKEAEEVGAHTLDVSEFLTQLKREGLLDSSFVRAPGDIAYHIPCHYRAQKIGNRYVELLRSAGGRVKVVDKGCSGIDGTWGMKRAHYEDSQRVASKMLEEFHESPGYQPCTDCLLAGLQISQGTGREVKHPLHILADSYGLAY